jgi:hypothetical protein
MSTYVERALGAPPSRLYARRAMDALETLSAGLPQTHLSKEAREEIALQVAELMGRLERLLSMLHQADHQAVSGSGDGGGATTCSPNCCDTYAAPAALRNRYITPIA